MSESEAVKGIRRAAKRREHADRLRHSATDELRERILHPAFYGSYDWHSAVHMHWLLLRVLRLYPTSRDAVRIAAALDAHLTPSAMEAELAYFRSSASPPSLIFSLSITSPNCVT